MFETEGLISTESLERVEASVLSPEQSRDRISLQKPAYFLVYQLTSWGLSYYEEWFARSTDFSVNNMDNIFLTALITGIFRTCYQGLRNHSSLHHLMLCICKEELKIYFACMYISCSFSVSIVFKMIIILIFLHQY